MKMAIWFLMRMPKTSFESDNRTCNTLTHGFVRLGLFDNGWVINKQMKEWEMQPDVITYGIMISKCDSALVILNTMVSCNLMPNVHCYTVSIDALHIENIVNGFVLWGS
ncbi:Pentatricopeptide repeat [Trema orientale]|uniref:Pentatricopeptide repeat n=1 Tax=Trema orientale TaxID=63057 RepID=A0A2P5EJ59_TREOI|nr:Pentatricopeptide repeat [Trema orientale]